ncbi:cell morphogenesis protein Sog2 [Aspergillus campestris IBT 28561]|uniref:Cell morphogenesis protein Sog2 n=1 Tax=Aspergillus campestris (strain IBT 28561) TaxID=1392248 RepID=A0A2I1CX38_ASPC2|nr:cell morphogenesis protein Sog2 [Aspergillus campestris IBT 28561]PKY02185.1 cell morphogenesis protein Sog2 [Aspergillus campestris IBT 28561]
MLSTMVRPEDTLRMPRSYHGDLEENGARRMPEPTAASSSSSSINTEGLSRSEDEATLVNGSMGDHRSTASTSAGPRLRSPEETIELARRAVENGIQETKRSLAGSEAVSDVVKPKLTIDLGHSSIVRLPEAVVDIIKDEVERLSLSHNHLFHIPYRFAECSHLKYLNIRSNNFREFPKGVYKLPFLEILDLSRNKLSHLPEEIKRLTSLRVLSVAQNRLDELPLGLSDMNKLQILKVAGNPLRQPLQRLLEAPDADVAASAMTDNEKEVALTAELKRFLKTKQPVTTPESEIAEIVWDTPRPVKQRGVSSRFPVIPSTGDSASDPKSPSLSRPPPIPLKSHYRVASGQASFHNGMLQRPGMTPLVGLNERNRSNSEGIIQASFAARFKRMGVINRKNTDLGTLNEARPFRNSHLRGLSHGSILRIRPSAAMGGNNSPSPSSPRERRRLKEGFVNRMSSLPEHKSERDVADPIIESAKGILFALFQVQSHISALINVIKRDDTRRNSLEIVFYNASTHVHRLNEALENAENPRSDWTPQSNEAVRRECETCIMAYAHVGALLRNSLDKIVANGDPRYVRSLMLMIYGGIVELRNACVSLGVPLETRKRVSTRKPSVPEIHRESELSSRDKFPGSAMTPTRGRDPSLTARRFRSDTTIQHPQLTASGPPPMPTHSQSALSSPGFAPPSFGFGSRSRSSSRSNMVNTSVPSSLATPRSGESFPPMPNVVVPRVNPLTGLEEIEEERIFERIFYQLTSAYTAALQALPLARRQLMRCLEVAEQTRESEGIQLLWNNLIRRCRICLEVSEALGMRLSSMKVKEPGGGMRNQREFWQLCKGFMQSFVDLVTDMREVRSMQLLPPDMITILRPVQRASREAGRLIEASPWSYLADMAVTHAPSNLYGPPLQTQHPHHAQMMSAPHTFNTDSSPTPLSAALGPAAQATIPSTPASAYSDKFFEGDVFQRADSLLSMPKHAPIFPRR